MHAVADLRVARGTCAPPPPPGVQILSISCSFWEISAKSYVGAPLGSWRPLLGEILDPPLAWRGLCMARGDMHAGKIATESGGTRPSGMHSGLKINLGF